MLCYPFPLKLLQEAYIIFVEQAQVVNVVATHSNTLQTQAKGKAAVFLKGREGYNSQLQRRLVIRRNLQDGHHRSCYGAEQNQTSAAV